MPLDTSAEGHGSSSRAKISDATASVTTKSILKNNPSKKAGIKRKKACSPSSKETSPSSRSKLLSNRSTRKKLSISTDLNDFSSIKLASSPQHVLVVDNGGDTIKYGWNQPLSKNIKITSKCRQEQNNLLPCVLSQPSSMPNLTARLPQQWTILVGDQLLSKQFQNPNSLLSLTRSMERGIIVDLGNQVQVWKRILDLMRVSVAPTSSETLRAFGWHSSPSTSANHVVTEETNIPASLCAVMITVPPFCPRFILNQITAVWLHDFGFARIGFVCSPLMAAFQTCFFHHPAGQQITTIKDGGSSGGKSNAINCQLDRLPTTCIVDLGWSATHIVPTIPILTENYEIGKVKTVVDASVPSSLPLSSLLGDDTKTEAVVTQAIRRVPLAGRHLTNLFKYHSSYRQWNLMDQEFVVRDVMEQTALVTDDWSRDMKLARMIPVGRRPYDIEYVLPDFKQTFRGRIRIQFLAQMHAEKLRQQQKGSNINCIGGNNAKEVDDNDDEEDASYVSDHHMLQEEGNDDSNDSNDHSSDEENPAQIRRHLRQQYEDNERHRREAEAEEQILSVSVERFAIPEALFRPSDTGLPTEWAGLPFAIVQSIEACPIQFRPALYQSIILVGGLSQLPGLKERIECELRAVTPCKYDLIVTARDDPIHQVWYGACQVSLSYPCESWSIGRQEFEIGTSKSNSSVNGVWKRFEASEQGFLV